MNVIVSLLTGLIFIVFMVLLYALLSANHDEEENLKDYDWVQDEFRIPYDDAMEDGDGRIY